MEAITSADHRGARRTPGERRGRNRPVSTDSRTRSARETLRHAGAGTGVNAKEMQPTGFPAARRKFFVFWLRQPSEKTRADRVSGRSARPWPEFRARREADTMADELKVRGTVAHDASVAREPIARRVSRPTPIEEERAPPIAFPRPPRRSRNGARSSSLLRGGSLPREERRVLRAEVTSAVRRDERARATKMPPLTTRATVD